MEDDGKKQMKAAIAVIAVIVGIGLAIFSGVHSLAETKPHIVGSLVGKMQGTSPPGIPLHGGPPVSDPAMGGGKAESDKN